MERLIESIMVIIDLKYDINFSQNLIECVLKRLESFGYNISEDDIWPLSYSIRTVENRIKNYCNTSSIPEGLFYVIVDMVCGDFLYTKKQTGQLELDNLELDTAISQISEGDTSVKFVDGLSNDDKLNNFIDTLKNPKEGDLICYRKVKW